MNSIATLYRPNHDELARQAFVGALKGHVNGTMEAGLAALYEQEIAEDAPNDLDALITRFEEYDAYRLWGSATYTSQDLLWESVGEVIDRVRGEFESRWDALPAPAERMGSLTLDPDLTLPEPIASIEIHRQPGGYFHEDNAHDLTAPLLYFSSIELYRSAKGLGTGADTGAPAMSPLMLKVMQERFPDLAPRTMLDMGCGPGTETLAFARAFPAAEQHGLDLSGPFVRFAHLWAEEHGVPVHYKQANAADTGYDKEQFDLITSHILFHETSAAILPQIMREAHRILAPGGVFFNADVPYQPHRLTATKRVTNAWQVANNGEPFWRGFAETDVVAAMIAAGFAEDEIFTQYVPLGRGDYFMFGARKKA